MLPAVAILCQHYLRLYAVLFFLLVLFMFVIAVCELYKSNLCGCNRRGNRRGNEDVVLLESRRRNRVF